MAVQTATPEADVAAGAAIEPFRRATDILDWHEPNVLRLARSLAAGCQDPFDVSRACFEWVRDEIQHSIDYERDELTCAASEVLRAGTGYCYAKSHLLVALLRANDLPAGLCYQRLTRDDTGASFVLHGLAAVQLPDPETEEEIWAAPRG